MTSTTELVVYGPYALPFESLGKGTSKRITITNVKEFWARDEVKPIAMKQGCYVFALKSGKGFMPWYVGKATKTFKQEALHDHKLKHYNDVVYKGRKGTPVLYFVAKPGNLKKIPKKQIDDVETFLIQSAYYKNQELKNTQKAGFPAWSIKGVVRGGKGRAAANAKVFKAMLRL